MISNYADHAANERTFLAWVRTTVAVVGFGLAVSRVSGQPPQTWSEVMLLGSGGLVILVAFVRMRLLHVKIARTRNDDDAFVPVDAVLAVLLAMLAVFTLHVS